MKMIKPQIQRAQETPSTRNMKKMTPIILLLLKVFNSNKKDKIIKTAREKRHVINRRIMTRMTETFSEETKQITKGKKVSNINSVFKYISFKTEG